MIGRVFRTGSAALSVIALAATFTAAPVAVGYGPFDAAAYAKGGGNGGGKGGGKGNGASKSASTKVKAKGGGGGSSAKRQGGGTGIGGDIDRALGRLFGQDKKQTRTSRTTGSAKSAPKTAPRSAKRPTETEVTSLEEPLTPLRPDQKGRWNASNANQNALDAHIRNENFNGTIGALAFYQLAGKAAAGEDLTEDEQNALDNLLGDYGATITDEDLEALLNSDDPDAPLWEVTDGTASCIDRCEGADADAANQDIANYVSDQNGTAEDQAIDDLWSDAQQRIIEDSNKSTDGIEDQLLDELAHDLGFERVDPDAEEGDPDGDPEVVVLPDDEPLIIITQ
jgi:hypothetical protein